MEQQVNGEGSLTGRLCVEMHASLGSHVFLHDVECFGEGQQCGCELFHIHLVGTQGLTVITHIQGIRFGALPDINATTVGGKLHLRTGIVRMDILLAHHSSRTVL